MQTIGGYFRSQAFDEFLADATSYRYRNVPFIVIPGHTPGVDAEAKIDFPDGPQFVRVSCRNGADAMSKIVTECEREILRRRDAVYLQTP